MSHPERERDPLADLLRQGSELGDAESARAREAFLQRASAELDFAPARRSLPRAVWLAPLAVAAAVALAFVVGWPPSALGYEVSGAVDEDGYIRVTTAEPAQVLFSDATTLQVQPGARLRIGERQATGAHVSVEQGQLSAHVTHTASTEWRFVAGPFRVHVTGTRFDLKWEADRERLEVVLHEGSVEVEGYAGSGPVAVRRGQRFRGDARLRSMLVTDVSAPVAEPSPAAALPATPPADTTEVDESSPNGKSGALPGSEPKISWAKLVAKGEFQRVVSEADARGTASCISSCDASELGALADAARYTGRSDLAEQCLLTLNRRFGATSGDRAAFLLGRLYENQGQMAQARGWYQKSLEKAPSGSFAAESLAGKMRTVKALEGAAAARPIASEYLKRYPSGVHASLARQLVQTP